VRALLDDEGSPGFTQGDPNLRNFLWDGQLVRVVDFEDSGRSDISWELADLVEHVTARCTDDEGWEQALADVDLNEKERSRLHSARRAKAIYWLLAMATPQDVARPGSPTDLRSQAERLLRLL
jgi:thiamine kinase-like enzyme